MSGIEEQELWEPVIRSETRPDGSILVWAEEPLAPYPRCLTERFMHWAETAPTRVWMAERGPNREMIEITYGDAPHKFEAGTPPIVQAIGLGAAIDYVNGIGRAAARAHEEDLITYATERVRDLNWITIHGTQKGKGAIMSFSMEGAHPHDVATIVDRSGIAIRAGQHCAEPLMTHLNVPGTARASFAMYNTRSDVDAFIAALEKAREFLG